MNPIACQLGVALLLLPAAVAAAEAAPSCFPPAAAPGPGLADPFRPPDERARTLNAAGKTLYRRGQWEAARAQYRAALAADDAFLAPRLNVACAFVRQERFAEAADEVKALLGAAYLPWSREILEAADLGALKTRPEMDAIRLEMSDSARRWGAGLADDVLFVARQKAALRIPAGASGVFILGLHQEIFAWSPVSNRYRQLTAEDGRVLGFVAAKDRRQLLYLTAEKLVRAPGAAPALRGVALHRLPFDTMTAAAPVPIPGDVTQVDLGAEAGGIFWVRVVGGGGAGHFLLTPASDGLAPGPARRSGKRSSDDVVLVSATGAVGAKQRRLAGPCPLLARDVRAADGTPALSIHVFGRPDLLLRPTLGASLSGLALP